MRLRATRGTRGKAFFISGFPVQKLAFLPAGTPQEYIDTYTEAFVAVKSHPDFKELARQEVGEYPVFTGEGAQKALSSATAVPASAKAFVVNWLQEEYGVQLQ